MKIAVCIKQVPTREWQPRLTDDKTWIRDQDASFEMNEPDAYALEEALRLKEKHGGEVVVCSAGPARVAQVVPLIPMKRIGQPEEIARSVVFLLSEEASYVTGANLRVSGGR